MEERQIVRKHIFGLSRPYLVSMKEIEEREEGQCGKEEIIVSSYNGHLMTILV